MQFAENAVAGVKYSREPSGNGEHMGANASSSAISSVRVSLYAIAKGRRSNCLYMAAVSESCVCDGIWNPSNMGTRNTVVNRWTRVLAWV